MPKKITNTALASSLREGLQDPSLMSEEEIKKINKGLSLKGALPLQALLRVSVLPFGHLISIKGEKGTGKSNLGWELMRRFIEAGGIAVFLCTESSDGVEKQYQLLHDPKYMDSVLYYYNINSMKRYGEALLGVMAKIKKRDPEGNVPVIVVTDSIAAIGDKDVDFANLAPKEMEKAIQENNMAAAHRAKSLKAVMSTFNPNFLMDRPVLMVMTNHLYKKIETNSFGFGNKEYSPCGDYIGYMASAELKMAKGPKKVGVHGNTSRFIIRNIKQRLGHDWNIKVTAPLVGWTREIDGEDVECLGYDWDKALVDLLLSDATSKTDLKEFLTIVKNGASYNCKELKLKGVSAQELGRVIHNNEELCRKIQKLYKINVYHEVSADESKG